MLNQILNITYKAGELAQSMRPSIKVAIKQDDSVVTNADCAVEELIITELKKNFGEGIAVLAEENQCSTGSARIYKHEPFWVIDPIDATAAYVDGRDDYCINIAYVKNGEVALGVIYAPDLDTVWYAEKGGGAYKIYAKGSPERISCRAVSSEPKAVCSYSGHHISDEIRKQYGIKHEVVVASAVKFCYVAEGKADYYFRQKNKAKDWDIAPGIIIVEEAGGSVEFLDQDYEYGVPPYVAPGLVVMGKRN